MLLLYPQYTPHCLQLECRLPWPISVALPPRSLDKYSRVLGLLLKLEFTTHFLEEAHVLHRYFYCLFVYGGGGGGVVALVYTLDSSIARCYGVVLVAALSRSLFLLFFYAFATSNIV